MSIEQSQFGQLRQKYRTGLWSYSGSASEDFVFVTEFVIGLDVFADELVDICDLAVESPCYFAHTFEYLPDLDFFGGTGFEEFDHETLKLQKNGETIYISGIRFDYPFDLKALLKDVPDSNFSILLYHTADFVEELENLNVDLYLSGHTHGGQVRLPFFGALTTLSKFGKKYEMGMYNIGKTRLYINRGIGLEGGSAPQVRFLARPEITVFDIEPAQLPLRLDNHSERL